MNAVYSKSCLSTANVDKKGLSTQQNSKMWINGRYGGGGTLWKNYIYRANHRKKECFSVDNFSTFGIVDKTKKLIFCG